MFGRSGPWMIRVGGPQPAPSKQTAINASTAERICRSGGLGGLVVARPMKGRLYPLSGSPLRAPICTPVVHQPTRTKANTTNALRRKSAILQAFLNNRERARRYGSDFARRRSGVRIPSAPLLKCRICRKTAECHREQDLAHGLLYTESIWLASCAAVPGRLRIGRA